MEPKLSQSQSLNLMQKAEMQLALRFLEAPTLELVPLLNAELEENPLLEWDEMPTFRGPSPELLEAPITLAEHLFTQLGANRPPHTELLIGYLDPTGLISTPLSEIAQTHGATELEKTLKVLQELEPAGVCCQSPREALLKQLKPGTAHTIIARHYDDLLHKRHDKLSKALNLTRAELTHLIETEIGPLNPYPGSGFGGGNVPGAPPDLWIIEEGMKLVPQVKLGLSLRLVEDYQDIEGHPYLKKKLKEAKWILDAIEMRRSTLVKLGELLITTQEAFLRDPSGTLNPLTLTEAANQLGLSDSTLSRAVAHKTLSSPRGIVPLRDCFSHEVGHGESAQSIKERLKALIAEEIKPLSDQALSEKLGCSRRVVAKYRAQLGIGNMRERGSCGSAQNGSRYHASTLPESLRRAAWKSG